MLSLHQYIIEHLILEDNKKIFPRSGYKGDYKFILMIGDHYFLRKQERHVGNQDKIINAIYYVLDDILYDFKHNKIKLKDDSFIIVDYRKDANNPLCIVLMIKNFYKDKPTFIVKTVYKGSDFSGLNTSQIKYEIK